MLTSIPPLTKNAVKKCFLILPYDARGDEVFEKYLREACERTCYEPDRADHQLTDDILSGIETALSWDPMVCAYLGSPPAWNLNVAIEVGYRLSTRRPLVLLCDKPKDNQPLELPFNIAQNRVIQLPQGDVDPQTQDEIIATIVRMILKREGERRPFASVQAVANIHCPTGAFSKDTAVFAEASELASELFGSGLVDSTLAQFYQFLRDDMPASQYEAFMDEQKFLIAQAQNTSEPVVARVPIVFRKGPRKGRAYLPMIVNAMDCGSIQELRVLYLDVTSVTKETTDPDNPDLKYYRCLLTPKAKLLPLPRDAQSPRPLVFLAHNSQDKELVKPIVERLRESGAEPWFDKDSIPAGVPWATEISKAIQACAAAFVFLGPDGAGPFQTMEIPALYQMHCTKKIKIVPVLLPPVEAKDITDPFLKNFNAKPYAQLKDEIGLIVEGLFAENGDDEAGVWGMQPPKPR